MPKKELPIANQPNKAEENLTEQNLIEENNNLKKQILLMQDLNNLEKKNYYRQQKLAMMERGIIALEKIAQGLEESNDDSNDDEE